jgi:hypothetical protein
MKMFVRYITIAILTAAAFVPITSDEGMYPISEINRLNLGMKGLRIDPKEVYNPEGSSLVDAICQLGGGTGEFVSAEGLILTNHHIAYSGVTDASTVENDYLKNGFTARTRAEEIPAKGYTCRISEAYRDVTAEVMSSVNDQMQPEERSTALREKMRAMAVAEQAGRTDMVCEVSEMMPGTSYVLFTYRILRDVRLVYVPPIGIGDFGGESDNWIWPRHTGDFSFMRAYVAPDGSTASYSPQNVPYKPKKFIPIAKKGIKDGDFVMILGYPGRTFRHKSSHFLDLQNKHLLPYSSGLYDWLIDTYQKAGEGDRALQLRFAESIKAYSNATKNYKGKLLGIQRLNLVSKRANEEEGLQRYIDQDSARSIKYGKVLSELGRIYGAYAKTARQEIALNLINRSCSMFQVASIFNTRDDGKQKDEEAAVKAVAQMRRSLEQFEPNTEKTILTHLLCEMADQDDGGLFECISDICGDLEGVQREEAVRAFVDNAYAGTFLSQSDSLQHFYTLAKKKYAKRKDALAMFFQKMQSGVDAIRARQRARDGELNKWESRLIEIKMDWQKRNFIPDANSTLRFTYGYIKGYSPRDAVRYQPMTTLRGMVEKNTGIWPYDMPQKLIDLYNTRKYNTSFEDELAGDVPIAMLYNTDTTGGNSGSPVMNGWGELIAINFDRTYEATINDYQWSADYSRSIGVDIRFVLFVAKYLGGADFLLRELGVKL